jgi:hypothetical protein
VPRPAEVRSCPSCTALAGRSYPSCVVCTELVDQFWLLDWQALLAAEGVGPGSGDERELAEAVLTDQVGRHPWTCTDWAMGLLECTACGAELGTGRRDCMPCTMADERRWEWDHQGCPDAMTPNEHELRVGRAVLRAEHRYRPTTVQTYRLTLPFVLAGESTEPGEARRIRAHLLAGGYDALAECRGYPEMAALPFLPWRRSS